MNNSFITEQYVSKAAKPQNFDESKSREVKLIAVISALRQTRAYLDFVALFIDPEMEKVKARLEREVDVPQMYRLQGNIDGLKIYQSLDNIEGYLRARIANYGKNKDT